MDIHDKIAEIQKQIEDGITTAQMREAMGLLVQMCVEKAIDISDAKPETKKLLKEITHGVGICIRDSYGEVELPPGSILHVICGPNKSCLLAVSDWPDISEPLPEELSNADLWAAISNFTDEQQSMEALIALTYRIGNERDKVEEQRAKFTAQGLVPVVVTVARATKNNKAAGFIGVFSLPSLDKSTVH